MSKVQRFWCDEARNIRCVREDDFDALEAEAQALREEVAALRARVVAVPDAANDRRKSAHYCRGWNACLDELAHLNGLTVSEELLRTACFDGEQASAKAMNALRAMLSSSEES
ncbi:hypothetical protein F1C11_03600 [Pseudomonas aeruginosa]|uniref:hypothetical protein n=1 Tax=Pseudomonas aeruginosa TaxID=287 RepID=UPI0006910B91|nr:hypothetical protein [Pseudomonas aeruginosa]KAA2300014.1 hypothetical protein F1C11_03600 [Pseudomonas aeruginosa]